MATSATKPLEKRMLSMIHPELFRHIAAADVSVPQYFLTRQQQKHLDHERRLTADHMRRLNQVLAGHLSYLEITKVHADRESPQALSAAPSHGSAVGYGSSTDDPKDANGTTRRASRGQTITRRLVSSTGRIYEGQSLDYRVHRRKAWFLCC